MGRGGKKFEEKYIEIKKTQINEKFRENEIFLKLAVTDIREIEKLNTYIRQNMILLHACISLDTV